MEVSGFAEQTPSVVEVVSPLIRGSNGSGGADWLKAFVKAGEPRCFGCFTRATALIHPGAWLGKSHIGEVFVLLAGSRADSKPFWAGSRSLALRSLWSGESVEERRDEPAHT